MAKLGGIFQGMGVLFLAFSFCMIMYNIREDQQAQKFSNVAVKTLMKDISENISENTEDNVLQDIPVGTWENTVVSYSDMEMPIQKVDGLDYIGVLEIPELSLMLPILDDWSYSKLKKAPCRYFGSSYQDNLVIMAHNYACHFGKLQDLSYGQLITFTDIDGNISTYQVIAIEIFEPTQVEEMMAGLGDLTLFTCTASGSSRVVVGCEKI